MHGQAADRIGIALLLAGGAMMLLLNFMPAPLPTAQETSIASKVEARRATEAQAVCEIYRASGDTSAFTLIKAVRTASGDLCVQYRLDTRVSALVATGMTAAPAAQNRLQDAANCESVRGKEITRTIRDRLKSC
ncbi:MAG: hypothetical protein NTV97_20690 [Alphaproteobacteria bacterium]|nr:hypothetical protein [Alphaproteobacteria bacterium]